ncbi:hypothetical protein Ddye_006112 [Dipteronia dyeriana]|uniref:MULE transposase domain-containing protein n=1 Tax=Dipteronia dyeriana TaxID=168575 RepID=A0AAD9XHJ1_9ROSI|nr:hypothetical protein Ddye_006112 [Dipteronia dyeriana]
MRSELRVEGHQRHLQANVVIIGEVVAPRLQQQDGHLMRPKDIIVNMKTIYVLEQQNPSTITDLQCDKDDKFLYFFMLLGASIRGFRRFIHLVVAVDGTHLKERFRGIMFVTIAQDRNEQVYPIAFGYDDSENNLSWEWFFDYLKVPLVI